MPLLLCLLGLLLILLVILDVLVTTLTVGGAGLITGRVSRGLWWLALRFHHRRSNHQMLATAGWIILIGLVGLWLLLCWFGWTVIFSSFEGAVVKANSLEPASLWERLYFTGFTVSTLGMGDYQPQGTFWQIATAIASTQGFILVTLSVAYLLPVVSAATSKRALAIYIATLGGTGDEILTRAWNGQNFGQLDQHLISLSSLISGIGEAHLTYPILHYFHSIERSRSMILSFVALDEALTLLQYGVDKSASLDRVALDSVRRANAAFLKTLSSAYLEPADRTPELPSLEILKAKGIPTVSEAEFWEATKPITRRRKLLLALVENDGWTWDAVASTHTTNRGTSLDDQTKLENAVLL